MEEKNSVICKKISCIAIYLRISKEDEKLEMEMERKSEIEKELKEESNSIKNQRELLLQFIQNQKEFEDWHILEFSDDGYSGINFNRPAIRQLFEQVKQGKIDCILVKDFSRFSRDYIELGSYLEQIFPFFGVRFLSLNDAYDSAKDLGRKVSLEFAFENLLSDWYSKDLSIKVKTSLKIKKEKGQYISPNPPYGYRKDPTQNGGLAIYKEEAEVVQMIFLLALQGKTLYEIAKFFNQKKVPTRTNTALWRAGTIDQILKNPFYTGDMIYDKYKKEEVGGRSYLKPREEWKCISNHHKAIIERELFEKVQNRKKEKREKIIKNQNINLFTGKVLCGACQKTLQIKNKTHPYFTCATRYITKRNFCIKRLEEDIIRQIVQQIIWKTVVFYGMEGEWLRIRRQCFQQKKEELQNKMQQIKLEQEKIKIKKTIEYKKYVFGCIEKEVYFKWKKQIQNREKEWIELQQKYNTKMVRIEKVEQEEKEIILCREFVEIFIRKIYIYNKQRIVIGWKFYLPQ